MMTDNSTFTICFSVCNIVISFLFIILNYRKGKEEWFEIFWYVGSVSGAATFVLISVVFNRKMVTQRISTCLKLFEFEKYRGMFDGLQEGVIVFDKPTDDVPVHKVFFVNELMQKILAVVNKEDADVSEIGLDDRIFYLHRSESLQNDSGDEVGATPKYSLQQVIEMS